MREFHASGQHALTLATTLLQRARNVDRASGIWEAADLQWWWRTRRASDEVGKLFWLDDEGPVAAVWTTSWSVDLWQCDPIVIPGTPDRDRKELWHRALEQMAMCTSAPFDVPVRDDDTLFIALAQQCGFSVIGQDSTAWMNADDRPAAAPLPDGFWIVDRSQRPGHPHPMIGRNGAQVADRLAGCSLYDPRLDLAVETEDGQVAGYSMFWADPVTGVGLVEPVRVENEFQRLGLARAMITAGIGRLVQVGVSRIKVSYETEAAGRLYAGVGFKKDSTTSWYQKGI